MWNPFGIKFWGNMISGFAIFMGICLMAFGVYIGMFSSQMLEVGSTGVNANNDFSDLFGIMAIVGSYVLAIGASTIARASIYIDVTRKMEIDEIQQNRWALVVLALGMSSFFLPMILKRTNGYGVSSDQQKYPVRYSLGKWFSMITFVFGIVAVLGLVIFSTYQSNGTDVLKFNVFQLYLDNNYVGENMTLTKDLFLALGIIAAIAAGLGLLSVPAFWIPASLEAYNSGKGFWRGYMVFFGVIYTIWCTIQICLAILSALLEILSAISRAFGGEHENILSRMLAIIMLPIILAIQGYIIMTCAQTLKGIWSKSDVVSYNEYGQLGKIQHTSGGRSVRSDTAF